MILCNSTNVVEATTALTKSSIELAEATANFGALKVIFGIFLVLIIVLMLAFIYQVFRMTNRIDDIYNSMKKVNEYFESRSLKTVGKVQVEIIMGRFFSHLANYIKYQVLKSRAENHIFDKEFVQNKVTAGLNNEFSELSSNLTRFLYNGRPLNEYLQTDMIQKAEELMIQQIYVSKDIFTISVLEQAVSIYIKKAKLESTSFL